MTPQHPGERLPPPSSGEATSKAVKKSKEQLDYLLAYWPGYVAHQAAKTLDRFWPRVFNGWYEQWPIKPTPEEIGEYGSTANAILTLRVKSNEVRAV